MKKRLLPALLVLALLLGLLPLVVFAATPSGAENTDGFWPANENVTISGKKVSDFQTELTISKDGERTYSLTGTLTEIKKADAWTAFNTANTSEQTGYFMAISIPKTMNDKDIEEMQLPGTDAEGNEVWKTYNASSTPTISAVFTDNYQDGDSGDECCVVAVHLNPESATKTWVIKLQYEDGELEEYTFDYSALIPTPTLNAGKVDGAPLGDYRDGALKIEKVYDDEEDYKVDFQTDSTGEYDYTATVYVSDLKAHENEEYTMGHWVGVAFPKPDDFTITGYKGTDGTKSGAEAITGDKDTSGNLKVYFNVDDTDKYSDGHAYVTLYYTKDDSEVEIPLTFDVDLTSNVKLWQPSEDAADTGITKDELLGQIADQTNEDGEAPETFTTEVEATGGTASATIQKGALSVLKDAEISYEVEADEVGSVTLSKDALEKVIEKLSGDTDAATVEVTKDEYVGEAEPEEEGYSFTQSFTVEVKVNGAAMEVADWSGVTGGITLKLYVGSGLNNPKLYYLPDGEDPEEVADAQYSGGYITATVDHLSEYAVATYAETPVEGVEVQIVGGESLGSATVSEADGVVTVTVTVTDDTNNRVYAVTYTGEDGKEYFAAEGETNVYTFTKPEGNVTVKVYIVPKGSAAWSNAGSIYGGVITLSDLESGKYYVCQYAKLNANGEVTGARAIVEFEASGTTQEIKVLDNESGYAIALWKADSAPSALADLTQVFPETAYAAS